MVVVVVVVVVSVCARRDASCRQPVYSVRNPLTDVASLMFELTISSQRIQGFHDLEDGKTFTNPNTVMKINEK